MATALFFRFPFHGPWGEDLARASLGLAQDIAAEPGLLSKAWLEDREQGLAGGFYLFADADSAGGYRDKHLMRLSAMGVANVEAATFAINGPLSVVTRLLAHPCPSAGACPRMEQAVQ